MSDEKKFGKDAKQAEADMNNDANEKIRKADSLIQAALQGTPYVLVGLNGIIAQSPGGSVLDKAFICKMAGELLEHHAKNTLGRMGFFGAPPEPQEMPPEIREAIEKAQAEAQAEVDGIAEDVAESEPIKLHVVETPEGK